MAESSASNRLKLVGESYKNKDVEMSKLTHDSCPCAEEKHKM